MALLPLKTTTTTTTTTAVVSGGSWSSGHVRVRARATRAFAIGLTCSRGITIATIANLMQEQCALGPTIIFEAGTTHPYYISPNLCTIGTHTPLAPRRPCATRRRVAASSARPRPPPASWRSSTSRA